jgi:3-phenylpropionate/trans-cinnamate dioxygenase ferredoxin reductase component
MTHVVVIGAGQAGCAMIAKLRALGFAGMITLIGAEPVLPYQRPPLSKAYLLGDLPLDRLLLRPAAFYADHDITLRLGCAVTAIDPSARQITLQGGDTLAYDHLVVATGAAPRRLPAAVGGDLAGVHVMRDLADADALAPQMRAGRRILIIGGGYIGLEAAAVAAKRGLKVTLVEMATRILQRVAAPATADYFRALHASHGVDIREQVGLDHLRATAGRVSAAVLTDGSVVDVDLVIAGIGVTPASDLAVQAGLTTDNGIVTDPYGRTSAPAIWAAGDCATCWFEGAQIRLESVGNAIDQAEAVAQNIMGQDRPYIPEPWFWSDQYDCKLQIAGLNTGYDAVHIRQGTAAGSQSHWYYRAGRLIAVDAMNDPRNYMIGKRLIAAARSPDPALITDPASDLRALLSA